jgi:murein DD-endopeptidase MepM/ murein hydrolase activator NlpD
VIILLEKEVVKYTKEGIQKQNLVTGKTKMLTQSDYARQSKYVPVDKEAVYRSKLHNNSTDKNTIESKVYRRGATKNKTGPRTKYDGQQPKQSSKGKENKKSANYTYGKNYNKKSNTKYYYSYSSKVAEGKVQTHSDLNKGRLKHIGNSMLIRSGESIANDLKNNDNAALSGIGQSTQTSVNTYRGIKHLKSLWKRDSVFKSSASIKNTEYAAAKNAVQWRAAYVRQNAKKTAVQSSERAVKHFGKTAKLILKKGTLKFAAIAVGVLLIMMMLTQVCNSVAASVFGSTTEHPELTAYVMQLDTNFQDKINDEKEKYEKDKNTKVVIEGEDLINTDANVLAVLVTGDWTNIQLNEDNKKKIADYHSILNTYKIKKKSKSEDKNDGAKQITIEVKVYTAQEKINTFGFSEDKKKHVLEMLDVLTQINDSIKGNINTEQGSKYIPNIGDGEFVWAVPGHTYISSGYGKRVDPINGKPSAFHTGIDIPAPTGTPVIASVDGKVIRAGRNGGFGKCVIIQHKNGIQTLYGHNSAILVKVGDTVRQGQIIAKVGQTGRATGPHSHFEFRINGHYVNPNRFLKGA